MFEGVLSEVRPEPMEIELTVTVSGLEPGKKYALYKYDDETKIPESDFNTHREDAVKAYDFVGGIDASSTFVVREKIMSNEKAIFRAVHAAA